MIIDVKENMTTTIFPTGSTGFISYTRLEEQLRRAGEFKPHETVTHFKIEANGIEYVVKTLAGAAFALCLTFASPADAACSCSCVNSKLVTTCTDPLDVSVCKGECFGSGCLGVCRLDSSEQSRITEEAKANAWKLRKPAPKQTIIPLPPYDPKNVKPINPVLRYEQRI